MAITVNKIQSYMKNDFNVLISGEAGTGKTHMILGAAKNLGLTVKYYSASTLDPYADLVGIPVPQNDSKNIEFYRPRDIDEAEVIVFDELNRADSKTLNTVFELVQFRSINGERLPKLRCVMAAINPNDGNYTVDELDMALVDRFDAYLQSEPSIDMPYFKSVFGADVAKAVSTFWNDYERNRKNSSRNSKNTMAYISPRRMEKIVSTFLKLPSQTTIAETLPPDVNISPRELYNVLNGAVNGASKKTASKGKAAKGTTAKKKVSKNPSAVQAIMDYGAKVRHAPKRKALMNVLVHDKTISDADKQTLVSFAVSHLISGVGVDSLINEWSPVLERMNANDTKVLTQTWARQKKIDFDYKIRLSSLSNWADISKAIVF